MIARLLQLVEDELQEVTVHLSPGPELEEQIRRKKDLQALKDYLTKLQSHQDLLDSLVSDQFPCIGRLNAAWMAAIADESDPKLWFELGQAWQECQFHMKNPSFEEVFVRGMAGSTKMFSLIAEQIQGK